MIIDHLDDPREAAVLGFVDREHEAELTVEPYGPLAFTIARQLLKVKRFDGVKISLRFGGGENLHLLEKRPENIVPQPGMILTIGKRPLQLRILEPDVHGWKYIILSPLG